MTRTETIYLHVCAKLDGAEGATVDLYQCDPWTGADGRIQGCCLEGWWESLPVQPADPGAEVGIADFDIALTASGYRRIDDWRRRTGSSGRIRYSAFASINVAVDDV
ncbi:hypothetical protein [Nocardia cyriacigeorgica]|uniref:hypothetical protein n=1 Tax=Nocardia cyriacigeorgica TaxID=135487 RepID=UPI002454B9F4|nr:hypothetical protein [Nocardia cyriacigeorgica]